MSILATFNISSRRYLGNKTKLLPFILEVVKDNCKGIKSVADIFSGTGSVANTFIEKTLYTNDILQSNYISNIAWFSSQRFERKKLEKILKDFNTYDKSETNYMTENFSNTYFSDKVCSKIGFVRESIESLDINERERAILITSLLYAMDKIAATCGHYDAFRKGVKLADNLSLAMPQLSNKLSANNCCFNKDANELVKEIYADLIYIDPPYNSRQYSDAYHLLENVATWQKPQVFGIARKMNRLHIKSKYCSSSANDAFIDLISNINAKYILFSYNNMATKGNSRSNARISDEVIMNTLNKKGKVSVFSQDYKAFNAGKSNIKDNSERLFLCNIR
ncbi:DNA adenine methylase [Campylobacter insulaenigrae]|uniref:DNA adenine methylase n=1 Tax=Campylobacter insulaenigrae TaxID=260714 RepID=UPI0021538F09|nr:DNA adenine methylase [Campylobacter insulaenigrae]MCR6578530.1 DNA adenine methylase [Campylobacter insulaenigrae]